ncbi:hypothetical protein SCALIN_C46_0011 [Candidatus Scalindua japonica]|uniref:Uncharacterized protein n=2 Tax=Candidatus Scalindua japonica TaxID=1284222 RepID=A0A286U4E7_9BACT|nr:hypothetical protein SCALIN_C46_0011 [Candidatus Scalindua japonica]
MDTLIPTKIPVNFNMDVGDSVVSILKNGVLPVFEKETGRWSDYFFLSNSGEFFALILALVLFIVFLFRHSTKEKILARISIPVGCLSAIGVLALDPHPWADHAIPIVPFFFLILCKELELTPSPGIKNLSRSLLLLLTIVAVGLLAAFSGKFITYSIKEKYSESAVIELMDEIFKNKEKHYTVVGPTELWPYINPDVNVTIIDTIRGNRWAKSDFNGEIDYVILNNDFAIYDWESNLRLKYPNIVLKTVGEVGNAETDWFFVKVMKPVNLNNNNYWQSALQRYLDTK